MTPQLKLALVAGALAFAAPNAAVAKTMVPSPLWVGTWKLNIADSKFANPGMRTELRVYRLNGHIMTVVSGGLDPDGKPLKFHYRAAFDGNWYPLVGNPVGNRIAMRLVSPFEQMAKVKQDDHVTGIATINLSSNGKRITMDRKIRNARGTLTSDFLAYDRIR